MVTTKSQLTTLLALGLGMGIKFDQSVSGTLHASNTKSLNISLGKTYDLSKTLLLANPPGIASNQTRGAVRARFANTSTVNISVDDTINTAHQGLITVHIFTVEGATIQQVEGTVAAGSFSLAAPAGTFPICATFKTVNAFGEFGPEIGDSLLRGAFVSGNPVFTRMKTGQGMTLLATGYVMELT